MKSFEVTLGDDTARFYELVTQRAGLETERVLADSLFRLAGELALRAGSGAQMINEDGQ